MPQPIAEQLSSLVDGELAADSGRFLLRRMGGDAELRGTWARYHMARDCLRGGRVSVYGADFADRVAAAIASDPAPAPSVATTSPGPRWLRPLAGAAVAASVAVGALIFVGAADEQTGPSLTREVGVAQVDELPDTLSHDDLATSVRPSIPAQTVSWGRLNTPRMDPRLGSYVLRHNRQSGSFRNAGFVPYVYYVTTPPGQEAPLDPAPSSSGASQ